jgi:glycosyltransferase involved in cell wall biosynthesis
MKYWDGNNITVVAPSKWMYECLKKSKLFSNIKYIPNFVDTHVYCEKEYLSSDRYKILFGAVDATSVPYKGYKYLLDALEYIYCNFPQYRDNLEVQVFGSKTLEKNEVLDKFKKYNFGVLTSDEKLANAYQGADLYVLPSLDDNLPSTVLESMSCGTPTVAFEVGGIPDMIDHKENGYLAKYKDSEDLAKGIIWVIENNKDFKLSKSARKKIESTFCEEVIIPKYIDLYSTLLENK